MTTKKWVSTVLYFSFFIITFVLIYLSKSALAPYIIGIVVAYVCYPFVFKLDKFYAKKINSLDKTRTLSILTFLILFFLFLGVFALSVGGLLVQQLIAIGEILVKSVDAFLKALVDRNITLPEDISVQTLAEYLNLNPSAIIEKGLGALISTIGALFSIGISLFMLPFFMFYIMYNPTAIKKGILNLFPKSIRADVSQLAFLSSELLNKYIRSQVMLCFIIFAVMLVGFLLIGMPNAFALAFIAGILELIPIFGPIMAWLISFVVSVPLGLDMMVWVSVVALVVQQLEGNYLTPKIQGDTVNFPAWIVILIVVVFGGLFGLVGAIVGLPFVAIFKEFIHYTHLRLTNPKLTPKQTATIVKNTQMEFETLN